MLLRTWRLSCTSQCTGILKMALRAMCSNQHCVWSDGTQRIRKLNARASTQVISSSWLRFCPPVVHMHQGKSPVLGALSYAAQPLTSVRVSVMDAELLALPKIQSPWRQ